MRGGPSLKHTRRRHLQLIAAAAITPALPRVGGAQSWPAKPIRVFIPCSAGSTIDIVARIVCEPLGRQLGQALVIENRGGAGGTVGAAAVARAEPDGYTLMAHSSAHVTTPAIYPNAPYDTVEDFAAVAAFGSSPNVTVVAPEKGIKTLQQLVAAAPAKTPREIVDKLAQETQTALAAPGVREKLAQQGMDPMPITPAAFDAQIRREIDSILALAKAANLKFN